MSTIVRGSGPRAGLPDYIVHSLGSDRYGVFKGSVERHHVVGEANQRIDPRWASVRYAPDPGWGIPCVDVDGSIRDSMYVAMFRYEGLNGGSQFTPTEDQKTFELDGNMGDRRIELHPRFDELKRIFGWDAEQRTFAEFMPAAAGGNVAVKVGAQKGARSKLAGVDSWFYVGLTYRITYVSQTMPNELLAKIGTLIKSPPNIGKFKLPKATQNRRWLVMAPKVSLRGNSGQISEEYLLGEPGGLPEAIYSFGQLSR